MSVTASQFMASQPPSLPPSQRDTAAQGASSGAMRLTIPAPSPEKVARVAPPSFNNAEVGESPDAGESEALSFFDFLDLINPLQHIPIVSSIYRQLTGDAIRPEMQMAGAALLGGPVGLLAAGAHAVFEAENGRGVGEEMLARIGFDGGKDGPVTPVAEASGPVTQATAEALNSDMASRPERIALNTAQANGLDALITASSKRKDSEGARVIARFQAPPQANAAETAMTPTASTVSGAASQNAPNSGVPSLMQDALQKYEALMRARQRGETPQ